MALESLKPKQTISWHLKEGFPQNMPDDEWLSIVAQRGWIIFTQDRSFHKKNEAAMEAIRQHTAACFYIGGANETTWNTARFLLREWDRISDLAEQTKPPYILRVCRNGTINEVAL